MAKSVSLVYIQPKTALVIALALHGLKCKCKISTEKQLTDIGARKSKINIKMPKKKKQYKWIRITKIIVPIDHCFPSAVESYTKYEH